MTFYKPQSPARIVWEEALYRAIEEEDMCRSDAQSIVEAKGLLVDQLFEQGVAPEIAAKRFTG